MLVDNDTFIGRRTDRPTKLLTHSTGSHWNGGSRFRNSLMLKIERRGVLLEN